MPELAQPIAKARVIQVVGLAECLLALTRSRSDAATVPILVDYDVHERDVIQVKLHDGLSIRAQDGRLHNTDSGP